ncbi:hypothetical protein T11_7984 [Trichinella zimbabwensis]|uniref:Uncharacterized protein n=1 Tax=Trichinella zimbabwensis TaxID=268475 RepID=A0A0V1GUL3_9BILA|nr:hypothetical protein T11_7984 [Trichinella zimbabwensis]
MINFQRNRLTRPVNSNRWYVPKQLEEATHVFIHNDPPSTSLSPLYCSPFVVVSKTQKTVTVIQCSKKVTVRLDRVKPAFCAPPLDPPTSILKNSHVSASQHVSFDPYVHFAHSALGGG